MENPIIPIFYDPKASRWQKFTLLTKLFFITLFIIFTVLGISIFINPILPNLGLSAIIHNEQKHHSTPLKPTTETTTTKKTSKTDKLEQKANNSSNIPTENGAAIPSNQAYKPQMIAFYVNWDDTSFTSLKQSINNIDVLTPEWLHLQDSQGAIEIDDPPKQQQALSFIKATRPNLRIVPLVNNFHSATMEWESNKLEQLLANPSARQTLIKNLLNYVQSNHFAGISIDFENLSSKSQKPLLSFMQELYSQFHPLGLEVSESVPFEDPEFNYKELANYNDYLILMAYDEHWSESSAGAVASQKWFSECLKHRFNQLPPDKLVVALGNYGYDWQGNSKKGTEISFQEAIKTAQESEGKIALDPTSLNPTFDYYDDNDKLHHVWFLDAVTAFNEVVASQVYQPKGFALWRLGAEDPSIWSITGSLNKLDQNIATNLRSIHYGYDLDYEGTGEILKVNSTPHEGSRSVNFDLTQGLITSEKLIEFPSPYVITRLGGDNPKKIALTFDDGPDPTYTPKVLDILSKYHVPATFFIVGMNGNQNQGLLKRIFAEGSEIGNHTFTHPNISMISDSQLKAEVNATQRLLESLLGRQTLLFRPPYAEDVEPENPDQVKPLLTIGDYGYYTIGMQIDPNDWQNPGIENIVNEVISQIDNGQGNIVLLHDSGGDRSQTIAALPQVIEKLKAKGYQLVTVSDLMGVSRDKVMPLVPTVEKTSAYFDKAGFTLINWFSNGMKILFTCGIVLGILRLGMIILLALYQGLRKKRITLSDCQPFVSVIVPAYNEEKVVCKTIDSLLKSDYHNFNIIVVDDGSKDSTYQCALNAYQNHPQVRVFTKENGGKAAALNFGISQTEAEIVICLDADTLFMPDAISKLAMHFTNEKIGAVAGNAKVGNRLNLLTKWQALEYITSQNLDRRAFDTLNCITVVPGAIGAWRRDLVLKAGGFTCQTLAEDSDLTLSILEMGYKVIYEENAIALTEAPDTVSAFIKQRFRWTFGTLQSIWKHKAVFLKPRYQALGFLAIPNVLIFQVFFPLISPIMDLLMVASIGNAFWQRYQHPTEYSLDGLKRAFSFYILFLLVDLLAATIAFALERKEEWRLIIWLFFQRFFYRQLLYIVAVRAILAAIRGGLVGWGKLERKATVEMTSLEKPV